MSNTNDNLNRSDLKIWQQNLCKSPNVWEHLLKNLNPDMYDLACIQEPFLNAVNLANTSNLNRFWDIIYPTDHHSQLERSQTLLLVNKRLSKNHWQTIPLHSPNVIAIEITGTFGKVHIYNIYNQCENENTVRFLERHMHTEHNVRNNQVLPTDGGNQGTHEHIIWLGDFNRHHPMWEPINNTHLFTAANLDAANNLINLVNMYNLVQVLPPGLATLEASNTKNLTRPDNVFCSESMEQCFTECDVKYHLRPVITDHFPIISTLDLQPNRINTTPKPNYRDVDWDIFNATLADKLDSIPIPAELTSAQEFETAFANLTRAISEAVQEHVPMSKPSPYAKRWWSKDLENERKSVHRLCCKARSKLAQWNHPIHKEYRRERNKFSEHIKKAKLDHWNEWMENITPTGIWNFHHYAASNPSDQVQSRIATLKDPLNNANTQQDNTHKSELLYDTFFKPPRKNDDLDPDYEYDDPVCEFKPITDQQIFRAIARLAPYKAPGPNGISNIVFHKCATALVPFMGPIFRATFSLSIYPEQWKRSSTIVLRKPGRPDYSAPKAYRPITLLDSMAKILSSCVADDITYIAEQFNLLLATHFRGRPGRSTTDSLHLLVKFITDAWASKESYVSLLLLDVKAAFPSVTISRLMHNLKKARIPHEYVRWYQERLTNRTTTLSFDNFTSDPFNVQEGVNQGCPLSPLAFIFYNSDLLRIPSPNPRQGEPGLGFIDNITFAARAKSFEEANRKLTNIMERPNGALSWSEAHRAEFELEKTALICLSRKRESDRTDPKKTNPIKRPPIMISGHIIQPSRSHKFLGVIIDEELRFKQHAAQALAKGTNYTLACNRMTRTTKGIKGKFMQKLFDSVILPKMLYATDIWCSDILTKGRDKKTGGRGARGFASQMTRVQRMTSLLITGGMHTTASDITNIHANLLPFQQNLRKICRHSALRMSTLC